MTDADRLAAASRILAGLCANPAVIGHNARQGFSPVNCDYDDLSALAVDLTADLITTLEKAKPTPAV